MLAHHVFFFVKMILCLYKKVEPLRLKIPENKKKIEAGSSVSLISVFCMLKKHLKIGKIEINEAQPMFTGSLRENIASFVQLFLLTVKMFPTSSQNRPEC